MSTKHNIIVNKTATYYSLGDVKSAKTIWFVLHGYGMLVKYFIKKFEPIANDETYIVAPEGLSKFYNEGLYGKVGASWMTKEDREDEIKDYINYLNQLYQLIIDAASENVKINILGFSQGGATASRWVADKKIKLDNFILWSSVFPDEMEFETFGSDFSSFIICGNNDEFNIEKHIKQQIELLNQSNLKYQLIEFDGTHDIPKEILIKEKENNDW